MALKSLEVAKRPPYLTALQINQPKMRQTSWQPITVRPKIDDRKITKVALGFPKEIRRENLRRLKVIQVQERFHRLPTGLHTAENGIEVQARGLEEHLVNRHLQGLGPHKATNNVLCHRAKRVFLKRAKFRRILRDRPQHPPLRQDPSNLSTI